MANEISNLAPLPKWLQYRFAILYAKHKDKSFTQEQAERDLGLPRATVRVVLSEIRRAGWLDVEMGSDDIRKFTYVLKNPETICRNIGRQAIKNV
jgi:hypothetical protein